MGVLLDVDGPVRPAAYCGVRRRRLAWFNPAEGASCTAIESDGHPPRLLTTQGSRFCKLAIAGLGRRPDPVAELDTDNRRFRLDVDTLETLNASNAAPVA